MNNGRGRQIILLQRRNAVTGPDPTAREYVGSQPASVYEATTAELPFNAGDEIDSGSGSEEESGTGSFTKTDTDLYAYEQVLHRAEPVRTHRRAPAAFANAIDACLEPDPARRPTLEELTRNLQALA